MTRLTIILGVVLPLVTTATPLLERLEGNQAIFNAPVLKHFFHMEALTSWPTNVSAIDGIRGSYPNVGGITTPAPATHVFFSCVRLNRWKSCTADIA
jgi:hypothetical protein